LTMDKINMTTGRDHTDDPEVLRYDTLENRVQGVVEVVDAVLQANTYEEVFIYGVSEGALITPLVVSRIDHNVSGIIVQGVGTYSQLEGFKILGDSGLAMPEGWKDAYQNVDETIEMIDADPDSIDNIYMGLPYLRWATYGKYDPSDDFLHIDIPILLVHGCLDISDPVEGARALEELFQENQKNNFTYIEYADMAHGPENAEQAEQFYSDIMDWIKSH
jgi:alpha-beta hydrolase superfamily lysophospholipase